MGICITDKHDVTQEDYEIYMAGMDEYFYQFDTPRKPIFAGRDAEWKKQYELSRRQFHNKED